MEHRADDRVAQDDDAAERLMPARPRATPFPDDDSASHPKWCIAGAGAVRVHEWGADMVVFIERTAATHWLSTDTAALMRALFASSIPRSALELATALKADPDTLTDVRHLLPQMEALGLVACQHLTLHDRQ
jgi:hypothetical protein